MFAMWSDHVGSTATVTAGLMVLLVIVALASVGAVMWIVLEMARGEAHAHPWVADPAEVILAHRYARGEIDANQYWQLLGGIRRQRP